MSESIAYLGGWTEECERIADEVFDTSGLPPAPVKPAQDGTARYTKKREAGLSDVRYDGSKTSAEVDRQSYAAEKWAADRLGVPFNEEIYARRGDGGHDFVKNGKRVEVVWFGINEATGKPRKNGNLLVNPEEPQRWADIYVLVGGSVEEGFYWVGWARHADVVKARKKDMGYGLKWAIPLNSRSPKATSEDTLFLRSPEPLP